MRKSLCCYLDLMMFTHSSTASYNLHTKLSAHTDRNERTLSCKNSVAEASPRWVQPQTKPCPSPHNSAKTHALESHNDGESNHEHHRQRHAQPDGGIDFF